MSSISLTGTVPRHVTAIARVVGPPASGCGPQAHALGAGAATDADGVIGAVTDAVLCEQLIRRLWAVGRVPVSPSPWPKEPIGYLPRVAVV
jgi:hypothetical protein